MARVVAVVIYVSAHDLTLQVMSRLWLCQCYCRKVSSAYAKVYPSTAEGLKSQWKYTCMSSVSAWKRGMTL